MAEPTDIGQVDEVYRGMPWSQPIEDEDDSSPPVPTVWADYGTAFDAQARTSEDANPPVSIAVDTSTDGVMILSLTADQTAAMTEKNYVFDVRATGGAIDPNYLFRGRFEVRKNVTRDA